MQGTRFQVVEASDSNGAVQLVQLRNPWGKQEWKGAYSDKDKSSWTRRLRNLLAYDPDKVDSNDGAFWMSFNDFTVNFENVYLCRCGWQCVGCCRYLTQCYAHFIGSSRRVLRAVRGTGTQQRASGVAAQLVAARTTLKLRNGTLSMRLCLRDPAQCLSPCGK